MRSKDGFTLLELMIVVAIIAVVTAIAIPNLVNARKAANEASAIRYMRSWATAQEQHRQRNGFYADADGQLVSGGFVQVGKADKHGYTFSLDNPSGERNTWWGQAVPNAPGFSGDRFFFVDGSGVIRSSESGPANTSSKPIGN